MQEHSWRRRQTNMNHLKCDENSGKNISREEQYYTILIIYDIIDNKKRNRIAKFLEGYGTRVQKSAFEAYLTKKCYNIMSERAAKMIDIKTDSLRIYFLTSKTFIRNWGIGKENVKGTIII